MTRKLKTYWVVFHKMDGQWFHEADRDTAEDAADDIDGLLREFKRKDLKVRRMPLGRGHRWTRETIDALELG